MARGINKVILVGNLGADPEKRLMPSSNRAVTNIRIATSEAWKDRQTGDPQERTEWHTVVLFDKLGEIAAEYLRKGSQVYIEGSLRTRKWQDKQGVDRYSTEIVAREMQMLGGRGGGGGGGAMPERSKPAAMESEREPERMSAPSSEEEFDDEIPFWACGPPQKGAIFAACSPPPTGYSPPESGATRTLTSIRKFLISQRMGSRYPTRPREPLP